MIAKEDLDAVSIATPDHWHARQILDALAADLHVYCEKPMTKSVEEALDVVRAWEKSGRVMQVGVQGTSMPVLDLAREKLNEGLIGKVLMFQTEYFRNSYWGQWRNYELTKDMNPKTINWDLWLGKDEGLAEDQPFDREVYKQWRRFWPFGSGMYTDLFVHRMTWMLKATGLLYPGRVVGAGGIYLEYDGRTVPDVATVAADYPEGVHGLISSTMCNAETPLRRVIRGHFGSLVMQDNGFDFIPERPQVTKNSKLVEQHFAAPKTNAEDNLNATHFANWLDAIEARDPQRCHNPPDLGAAAVTAVILGREAIGKARPSTSTRNAGFWTRMPAGPTSGRSCQPDGAHRNISRAGQPAIMAARSRNRPGWLWRAPGRTESHRAVKPDRNVARRGRMPQPPDARIMAMSRATSPSAPSEHCRKRTGHRPVSVRLRTSRRPSA